MESQLPQGMSGEKLKELEKGFIPDVKPEEKVPTEPPRFITQVRFAGQVKNDIYGVTSIFVESLLSCLITQL